ncbi:TIGR03364 family FAD-dependent oxidoreductase [Nocardia flavorosea]|uniref:TIGR03364 family FAD-dependent oxidoreductase n=1 Tax=Nocardia flavorosea TaxID=53429 RepID=A0A846YH60_9NOCA|nr:TIGR03364 family FAD-dependent oxidoreductase [Nocardia flavorosea]NKY58135.1 TIGR03364 family FAD-dependent oxidoreductase [Nocardia flavorosea]
MTAVPPPVPRTLPTRPVDLAVVGAGIVGLAHAVDAVERGLRIAVVERDARAVGASIRNFGHLCTTPQTGTLLDYAMTAREKWLRLSEMAGFDIVRAGTLVVARSTAEMGVLEEFAAERGREQVRLLDRSGVEKSFPAAHSGSEIVGGAHLPLDLRVDPRAAVPALTNWLAAHGVDFFWNTHAGAIAPGVVHTARGDLPATAVVHASGHDVDRLFPALAEEYEVRRCKLHMLEVDPPGDIRIDPAVLTGYSMLRYGGLAATAAATEVRREITDRAPETLDVVMNLMFTQRPDGAIALGDTHHYDRTHLPFDEESVTDLVLREGARLFGADRLTVRRRWRGIYADSPETDFLVATPAPGVRVVSVTSGIGMTTALGLAPTVLDDLMG